MAHVIAKNVWIICDFNGVGDIAKDGTDPQEHRETAKELIAEFHPFGRCLWRRQSIWTITFIVGFCLCCRQTLNII